MVDFKRYNPSNKRFQEHTQNFVEGKTKKGHLQSKKSGDKYQTTGQLVKVKVDKVYEDGWYVKVDNNHYWCTYGDNIVYLPPHTVSGNNNDGMYYIPKKKCEVEVSIDKENKMYTITRINDSKKQPIGMDNDGIIIHGSDGAKVAVQNDTVEVSGTKLTVENDVTVKTEDGEISLTDLHNKIQVVQEDLSDSKENLSVQNDIKIDTTEHEDLPDEISIVDMYREIQILKADQASDTNAGNE